MGDALPFIPLPRDAKPRSVAVTSYQGCAVLRDGRLSCWGSGADEGKTRELDFGPGRAVRAISLQDDHSCALFEDGSVRCWGANYWGQLGIGSAEDVLTWSADTPAVDLGRDAIAIAVVAAPLHSCALLAGGAVKCWGNNRFGQLGQGDTDPRGDEPRELGDFLPPIDLGMGRHAVAIGAGEINTCALLDDGSVKCWGGDNVQLGLGDLVHGDQPFEMGDALPAIDLGPDARVTSLSVGAGHACAVLDDGVLKCWGMNQSGELGLGDQETRGDDSWEMGTELPAVDFGGELLRE
jgi:alpha-tubulin suppressor-like RCC1 family protein